MAIDPEAIPVVAKLHAVIDEDVEQFELQIFRPSGDPRADTRAALESILDSLYPSVPRDLQGKPDSIRDFVGTRPRARTQVTCWAREGGRAQGEMRGTGGSTPDLTTDDPEVGFYRRVRCLLAAKILDELAPR